MIYISFSNADKVIVNKLKVELSKYEKVFLTSEEIKPGEDYINISYDALAKADKIVFVLSKHSKDSRYMQNEIAYAIDKLFNTGNISIYPIILDNIDVPEYLSQYKGIIIDRNNIKMNYEKIAKIIENQSSINNSFNSENRSMYLKNEEKVLYKNIHYYRIQKIRQQMYVINISSAIIAIIGTITSIVLLLKYSNAGQKMNSIISAFSAVILGILITISVEKLTLIFKTIERKK
jgi:hypothetical protein